MQTQAIKALNTLLGTVWSNTYIPRSKRHVITVYGTKRLKASPGKIIFFVIGTLNGKDVRLVYEDHTLEISYGVKDDVQTATNMDSHQDGSRRV
jgi:hypothetical protein